MIFAVTGSRVASLFSFPSCFDWLWCLTSLGMLHRRCRVPLHECGPKLAEVTQESPGTEHAAELRFPPSPTGACPFGLQYFIWNLVRKPQWHIFTFQGTFLACWMGALQAEFSTCTLAGVCQEFYYAYNCFCLSIPPLLSYIDIFSPAQCWNILQGSCLMIQWQDSK